MHSKDLLRSYLLGGLPASEQEQIERETGADGPLSDALLSAEDDLIDAYVSDELSHDQRRQFESYFLDSSERRTRVEFAKMLMSPEVREEVPVGLIVEEERGRVRWSQRRFSSIRWAVAAVTLSAAAATIFLLIQNRRLEEDLIRDRSVQLELQKRIENLERQAAQAPNGLPAQVDPSPLPSSSTVTLILIPGQLRNLGGRPRPLLKLSSDISVVVLDLILDTNAGSGGPTRYSDYDAVLETVEGRRLRTLRQLSSQRALDGSKVVSARCPAQVLQEGDYLITLFGRSADNERKELAAYSFSVSR